MLVYFGATSVHFLLRRVQNVFFPKGDLFMSGACGSILLLNDLAVQVCAAPTWRREEGGVCVRCIVEEAVHPID